MEQMIANIWNLNALLGGIIVFFLLVLIAFILLFGVVLFPFRNKHYDD